MTYHCLYVRNHSAGQNYARGQRLLIRDGYTLAESAARRDARSHDEFIFRWRACACAAPSSNTKINRAASAITN